MPTKTELKFPIGTRVRYTAEFCRSIGDYTDSPHWRGVIVEPIAPYGVLNLVRVRWNDDDDHEHTVRTSVLERIKG